MPAPASDLRDRLAREIALTGPMTVADYVTRCLHDPQGGYYATRPAIGATGDFITAPMISQMFGELIGLWAVELWGRPTDAPWGMVFCNDTILNLYGQCPAGLVPRHPSQLYEAALEGIALAVILWLAVFKGRLLAKPGYVTGLFLFGHGLVRASLENVRQPDFGMENLPLGLTMGMMLSIPMMLIGAWLIWRAWSRPPVAAED